MLTIGEMSLSIKKLIEVEIETIFLRILKKSLDTNAFIAEEVKKTLSNLVKNCSDIKIMPLIVSDID